MSVLEELFQPDFRSKQHKLNRELAVQGAAILMLLREKNLITDEEFDRAYRAAEATLDAETAKAQEEQDREFREKFPVLAKMFGTPQEVTNGPDAK